ncbi:MAG: transcription-repair coupling factor [Gammaproteobacteria bacterium]|nr:transcription-repair coupling factor [Gammaproteobacteria bacterium]
MNDATTLLTNILEPVLRVSRGTTARFGRLYGASRGLLIARLAEKHSSAPVVVVVEDMSAALELDAELRFFLDKTAASGIMAFPDWEILPYDVFSPHQDIISQRLETLYQLPNTHSGILIVPAAMLCQQLAPRQFVQSSILLLKQGQTLDIDQFRLDLEAAGYNYVSQVLEHGDFTVRGSLIDLYAMGSELPIRIDLFDNEVESIRTFDPETQRTVDKADNIRMLPAREFPFTEQARKRFRQNWRERFEGDPNKAQVYRDVTNGILPGGIEYYLPLFFEETGTLFDYLPDDTLFLLSDSSESAIAKFWEEVSNRYEQRCHDVERPILPPEMLFLSPQQASQALASYSKVVYQVYEIDTALDDANPLHQNFSTHRPPVVQLNARVSDPSQALKLFLNQHKGKTLFTAETDGRREALVKLLRDNGLTPKVVKSWRAFIEGEERLAIGIAPLDQGLLLSDPDIALITEAQLFGEKIQQRRRRTRATKDNEAIVQSLSELTMGSPVVHEDHGVGRYLGLQRLNIGGSENEFLALEYAAGDKLYVPVSSLHLISRYTGASPESAPLHRLGSDQWDKAKKRAAEKVRDVAAELLDIYARREAAKGHHFRVNQHDYDSFAAAFPFEETPDQQQTIDAIIADMRSDKPMDRLVCGDVGFGKTEVAMRAAFVAANDGKQVAVLVPTTLLAQQHFDNFRDRFADWPFRIEGMSRFKTKKEQDDTLKALAEGKVDIVIGTHKLIQDNVRFKNLGLLIVDEEHRFGVRQKEKVKAIAANIDLLSLTATPIPRTLNMALASLRDLSIIATPPTTRIAVKTFVGEWNKQSIREACLREIKRGGQVYFLHNEVESIHRIARDLGEIVPEAKIEVAHGQMRERELEQVMSDFYHRRFNMLVCTTIIESGIDIPTANTILIHRADKLGLAQLHQLRGRVGRSHHRAYAYLIVPPRNALTKDAEKRLEAIESLEDLGAGFMLASHDLEIRGAGELLGEEQSGQMHEIGFSLYTELLERAVKALKEGKQPELDRPLEHGAEVELGAPALIPDDYLPDVHTRLTMYKRIASATDADSLRELQVEMIDRFGLIPDQTKKLFAITEIKLKLNPLGVKKLELHARGGRIIFNQQPNIDPMKIIALIQKRPMIYSLDGQDKLRISKVMQSFDERAQFIDELIDKLQA